LNKRARAFAAFQASPGAWLEPDPPRRHIGARAVTPPRQPLPPPGPQPNSRQSAKRQALAARVERRLAEIAALIPVGTSVAERLAQAATRTRLEIDGLVDDAAEREEKLDRERGEADRVIRELTARVVKLEQIVEADTQMSRAIARLKASRS